MSASLLDTSVLIALLDGAHLRHADAHQWLATNRQGGWATCPIVQNGCLRIMSLPAYPHTKPLSQVAGRLAQAVSAPDHVFWPDEISLLSDGACRFDTLVSAHHLTDLYLLALAVHHAGRLVTFDRRIALSAVPGAAADHLLIL